ncbi:MAG: lipopolysaccharide biosynthesis protein [Actinomycetales bacterium]|nr:MAG: lipopolysaccharide biosynthesis protein [Actinomycetales bacterium]
MTGAAPPRVVVLLATCNGARYLDEQLDTILEQHGVSVRLVVGDDGSTDGTRDLLHDRALADPRIELLPDVPPSGSAAANFYRLLRETTVAPGELVALSDQDDRWRPGKLARQVREISHGAAGVSSDVVAFDSDGRRQLIRKSFPQRRFDYVCESPGPGSTFLLTPELVQECRVALAEPDSVAARVDYHDWLIYGIARAMGQRWVILDEPTVDYRQHEDNVMGANRGWRSALDRLARVRSHWHRSQSQLIVEVALGRAVGAEHDHLSRLHALLGSRTPRDRWALARWAGELRRRPRDQRALAAMVLSGLW